MDNIKQLVAGILADLQSPVKTKRQKLVDSWEGIAGPQIFRHTKPSLAPDGKLYVWVDEASLAFELNQKYKPAFLKRVQAVLGEEVKEIHFRVGQLR